MTHASVGATIGILALLFGIGLGPAIGERIYLWRYRRRLKKRQEYLKGLVTRG